MDNDGINSSIEETQNQAQQPNTNNQDIEDNQNNELNSSLTKDENNEELTKKKNKQRRRNLTVKVISLSALFAALSVISNTFAININIGGSNTISLTYTVCFFAGAILGPFLGFAVGTIGDVVGYFANPTGGVFNPIITLSTGLIGLLSGIVFWSLKKMNFKFSLVVKVIISYILIFLICTTLNTIGIWFYVLSSKYTLQAYYAIRTVKQLPFWATNLGISIVLVYPLMKISNMFFKNETKLKPESRKPKQK